MTSRNHIYAEGEPAYVKRDAVGAEDDVATLRRLPVAGRGSAADRARRTSLAGLHFRVGELAKRTGKTVRALHLYEEIGLLDPAKRTDAGYRLYSPASVTRVEWIAKMQEAGLSLPEIRDVLSNWGESESAKHAMQRVHSLFHSKLEETREQIGRLRDLESELVKSLDYLDTCHSCEPEREVTGCARCDRRDADSPAPVLVAGFHAPQLSTLRNGPPATSAPVPREQPNSRESTSHDQATSRGQASRRPSTGHTHSATPGNHTESNDSPDYCDSTSRRGSDEVAPPERT